MIKRLLTAVVTFLVLTACAGMANADLTTIGTATLSYTGDTEYKLLWDRDQNLVWLDYTKSGTGLSNMKMWAHALTSSNLLTTHLYDNYNVTWTDENWRTPSAGPSPSTKSEGLNKSSSEIGRLFYDVLGFQLSVDENDRLIPLTEAQLNSKEFDNLTTRGYWTDDGVPGYDSWYFNMPYGSLGGASEIAEMTGIAVRGAQVVSAVPVPAAIWLLGSGLVGLMGIRRKQSL